MSKKKLLEIKNLKTFFYHEEGIIKAVNGINFLIEQDQNVCLVGESGSGKSVTSSSILNLVTHPGKIEAGEITFYHKDGEITNILELSPYEKKMREIRGNNISIIFQEPMTALSPVHTIGNQIMEVLTLHSTKTKKEARSLAIETLRKVNIPKPEERMNMYSFELSGGMRQRAMIAIALAGEPDLLIADEPTTAVDVTTEATILALLKDLQDEFKMSVLFITHDLGVVAEIADKVIIMYLGKIMEKGDVYSIFDDPKHPYTQALLGSIPKLGMEKKEKLVSIKGMVPHPYNRPKGCPFSPRCNKFMSDICDKSVPDLVRLNNENRGVRCHLYNLNKKEVH